MYTATTLCFVRTDAGTVQKVAEGEPIPTDATDASLSRLKAAGALAEAKPAAASKPKSGS